MRRVAQILMESGGTNSGTFNAAAGAENSFTANFAFNAGTLFTGAGLNYLSAGTSLSTGIPRCRIFIWTAPPCWDWDGYAAGTNTFTRGWEGLNLPAGSTLNVVSGNRHRLAGRNLTNNGTIVDTSDNYIRGINWTIYNNGLWLEESYSAFYGGDGGVETFVNSGTFP